MKKLTKDQIIKTAFEYADQNGLETLSMRKISEKLNVKAMSLYNHVQNKDDILGELVEVGVSEIYLPIPGKSWKTEIKKRCNSAHEVLLDHRWLAMLLLTRINSGPVNLRYYDRTIGTLKEAGFSLQEADHAVNALDSHIFGFTLIELNFPFKQNEYAQAAAQYMHLIPQDHLPYLYDLTTMVASKKHKGIQDFNFGLDMILEGLTKKLANQED